MCKSVRIIYIFIWIWAHAHYILFMYITCIIYHVMHLYHMLIENRKLVKIIGIYPLSYFVFYYLMCHNITSLFVMCHNIDDLHIPISRQFRTLFISNNVPHSNESYRGCHQLIGGDNSFSSKHRVFIDIPLWLFAQYRAIHILSRPKYIFRGYRSTNNGRVNFSEGKHRTRAQHRYSANWSGRRAQHPWQTCRQIYPCPKCGRPFKWRYNLQHHLKFACGQSPRFNCPYCVFRTKHTSNVRAHVRRKHPGSEVYVVDILAWQQRNATTPTWSETARRDVTGDY